MRIEFADAKLERLAVDPRYMHGLGPEVVRAHRKAVGYLDKCVDERDIRAIRGYRFKQLEGSRSHQWSIRLNDQWRLILEFRRDEDGKVIVVVNVEDYHS
jgi:proteic killer suppression protein